jgi:hypothetical protein
MELLRHRHGIPHLSGSSTGPGGHETAICAPPTATLARLTRTPNRRYTGDEGRSGLVCCSRSRISRAVVLQPRYRPPAARRVHLNRTQLTNHMTGDIGGAPALARRRRIPAARCDSGEHGLEAIERANETIRNHVMQYLAGRPAPPVIRCPGDIRNISPARGCACCAARHQRLNIFSMA